MTNNYVSNINGKLRKPMPMNEINHWFRIWGIIGKRRQTHIKMVPSKIYRHPMILN